MPKPTPNPNPNRGVSCPLLRFHLNSCIEQSKISVVSTSSGVGFAIGIGSRPWAKDDGAVWWCRRQPGMLDKYRGIACSYIDTALLSNENVLVHCQQVRIVFTNGSIPANPILIHHWFPPGHFTERSHRDRLPDSKSQHVARRCICPRQGQAGLHETKFGFRSMPSGVGG